MRTNKDIIENIELYQSTGIFHPLTCGNDSSHAVLKGKEVDGRVILVCEDCDYTQEQFGIPSTEDINEILNNSPLHNFLNRCRKDT